MGGCISRGLQIASHRVAAISDRRQRDRQRSQLNRLSLRNGFDHLFCREPFRTTQNNGLADGLRATRRGEQASSEIVNIDQLMNVRSRTNHREDSALHRLEELEQSCISGPVGFRDTNDNQLDPVTKLRN